MAAAEKNQTIKGEVQKAIRDWESPLTQWDITNFKAAWRIG